LSAIACKGQLQILSLIDDLTGLHNRRGFAVAGRTTIALIPDGLRF